MAPATARAPAPTPAAISFEPDSAPFWCDSTLLAKRSTWVAAWLSWLRSEVLFAVSRTEMLRNAILCLLGFHGLCQLPRDQPDVDALGVGGDVLPLQLDQLTAHTPLRVSDEGEAVPLPVGLTGA